MAESKIMESLERIEELLSRPNQNEKKVLNFNEACEFLSLSKSYLYKHTGSIPHYKPNGKMIFFKRSDLEDWLLRNKVVTKEVANQQAADFLLKKGG